MTTTGQVGHGVQQRLEAGDLAGLLANAQPLQGSGDLPGYGLRILAELVKGR
ncbi:hypothetical protein ACFXKC_52000 [Streptomyces sp. NPDC059340]|uniref:hypothetical protein n=1 Tax=Streptomyces sp. NPDC059340 TaxID=3346806 RepID=UPI0036BB0DB3